MSPILSPLAEFLHKEKIDPNADPVVGPCFNYYRLDSNDPLGSVKNEIAAAVAKYDGDKKRELEVIQRRINGLRQLPAEET